MTERKTGVEQLRDLVTCEIGFTPPMILWPGVVKAPDDGELVTSADCGPKKVEATEKGDWKPSRKDARDSARAEARAAAQETCQGKCSGSNKSCKYLEAEGTITGPEEQKDPQNPSITLYRYTFTTRGGCQCE